MSHTETLVDAVGGLTAGVTSTLVGHPLDTVKVRQQLSVTGKVGGAYSGMIPSIRHIIKKEGVPGLFKGMASPLAFTGTVNLALFGLYGHFQGVIARRAHKERADLTSHECALAGLLAGVGIPIMSTPMELWKIVMQAQGDEKGHKGPRYTGSFHCAYRMVQEQGIVRGAYRGFNITVIRDVVGYSAYFGVYVYLNDAVARYMYPGTPPQQLSPAVCAFTGAFAGLASWVVIFPLDVIKTNIQTAWRDDRTAVSHLQAVWRQGGTSALFRGLAVSAVRSIPVNAVCFAAYETVKRLFADSQKQESKLGT